MCHLFEDKNELELKFSSRTVRLRAPDAATLRPWSECAKKAIKARQTNAAELSLKDAESKKPTKGNKRTNERTNELTSDAD